MLVSAISNLDTSLYWGHGKTSASDGQRFALRRKVLQQTYSPKLSDFACQSRVACCPTIVPGVSRLQRPLTQPAAAGNGHMTRPK